MVHSFSVTRCKNRWHGWDSWTSPFSPRLKETLISHSNSVRSVVLAAFHTLPLLSWLEKSAFSEKLRSSCTFHVTPTRCASHFGRSHQPVQVLGFWATSFISAQRSQKSPWSPLLRGVKKKKQQLSLQYAWTKRFGDDLPSPCRASLRRSSGLVALGHLLSLPPLSLRGCHHLLPTSVSLVKVSSHQISSAGCSVGPFPPC